MELDLSKAKKELEKYVNMKKSFVSPGAVSTQGKEELKESEDDMRVKNAINKLEGMRH